MLGANGAGKTTMFRMLCGLLPPATAGCTSSVWMCARTAAARAGSHRLHVPEIFALRQIERGGQLAILQRRLRSIWPPAAANAIDWATRRVRTGAGSWATTSGHLPLGYKQRLALACALMHEPEIIFLDEPTSGVDPLARREFWHRINALGRAGVTMHGDNAFHGRSRILRPHGDHDGRRGARRWEPPTEIKRRARSEKNPEPTMEDAFIHLIETADGARMSRRTSPWQTRRGGH